MGMLRDMNVSVAGKRDSTSPQVGVLASAIPTGFPLASFLLNDIDSAYPNRLYHLEILTLPASGVLYLDANGVGSFIGAPDGAYNGTQRIDKYDPGIGRVSSDTTTYTLTIGAAQQTSTVSGVTVSPATATIPAGGSQTFTATVNGTNNPSQGVTWETTLGTVTDGVVSGPAGSGTVTARSTFDTTKTGTAAFTILSADVPLPIDPNAPIFALSTIMRDTPIALTASLL